jgi:flagellar basal body-associated protein FliL
MGTMFEKPKQKDESSQKTMWIIIVVVIVVVGAGFYFYTNSKSAAPETASAPAAASGPADPMNDLRVTSVKMDKDSTGTTAEWLLDLRNRSNSYSYSHTGYETT